MDPRRARRGSEGGGGGGGGEAAVVGGGPFLLPRSRRERVSPKRIRHCRKRYCFSRGPVQVAGGEHLGFR